MIAFASRTQKKLTLASTADGKAKVTVTLEGSPASFFLRVKVKERKWKVTVSMHILPAK